MGIPSTNGSVGDPGLPGLPGLIVSWLNNYEDHEIKKRSHSIWCRGSKEELVLKESQVPMESLELQGVRYERRRDGVASLCQHYSDV